MEIGYDVRRGDPDDGSRDRRANQTELSQFAKELERDEWGTRHRDELVRQRERGGR